MSGCKTESTFITDSAGVEHKYVVTQKPASQSQKLLFRLMAVASPVLPKLTEVMNSLQSEDKTKAFQIFAECLTTLFATTEPDKIFDLLQELVRDVPRDGERITTVSFDEIYTGNPLELYKAAFFVLKVNYADFIPGLKFAGSQAEAGSH